MTIRRKTPPLPAVLVGPCKETEGADVAEAVGLDRGALIARMVDRFLGWRLPDTVCSDMCVSTLPASQNFPRYGTNLLTADEARQMIEYLFRVTPHDPEKCLGGLSCPICGGGSTPSGGAGE